MLEAVVLLSFASAAAAVVYGWRAWYLRTLVLDRLEELQSTSLSTPARRKIASSPLARSLRWLPWVLVVPAGLLLYFVAHMPVPFCVSIALVASLLGAQFEAFLADRKVARLESQLADAIDIMVGALGAGAGVASSIESAIAETSSPLRGQLEDSLGRIRFGDDARTVFRQFAERIPLETFLLFASTLSVHWEVGGSLAPTLATVGRTIRDRIDIARRIRSNTAQSQISTYMVLGLTYFIALVVYSNGPEQMREFLATSIGSFLVASSMLLQGVGILWMSQISRMRF